MVTGGLGYVGMALLDEYRAFFENNKDFEIWVVDKAFIPQRIVSLKN